MLKAFILIYHAHERHKFFIFKATPLTVTMRPSDHQHQTFSNQNELLLPLHILRPQTHTSTKNHKITRKLKNGLHKTRAIKEDELEGLTGCNYTRNNKRSRKKLCGINKI